MDINATEFVIIALILVLIVGPEKLPELAAQLGRVVREVKAIASGAKKRVEEELGPDIEELKKLDPRQYDPRRIVKDALLDPPPARTVRPPAGPSGRKLPTTTTTPSTPPPASAPTGESAAPSKIGGAAVVASSAVAASRTDAQTPVAGTPAPATSRFVPFDDEAT